MNGLNDDTHERNVQFRVTTDPLIHSLESVVHHVAIVHRLTRKSSDVMPFVHSDLPLR